MQVFGSCRSASFEEKRFAFIDVSNAFGFKVLSKVGPKGLGKWPERRHGIFLSVLQNAEAYICLQSFVGDYAVFSIYTPTLYGFV